MKNIKLNNGRTMPPIGFGTWNLAEGREVESAVAAALRAGYRLVDTARIYRNETGVGRAVNSGVVDRQDIFVTTKLWTSDFGYETALSAFEQSLARLNLEYIDLYLMHWPGSDETARHESWRALVEINGLGTAKSIGVSNFNQDQILQLVEDSGVVPAVNQIEFHPFIYAKQVELVDFCAEQGIAVEAYSPLAQARRLSDPVITAVAKECGRTPAQIMLRWAIAHGTVPIPRSSSPERIKQNLAVDDFELSNSQIQRLDGLG